MAGRTGGTYVVSANPRRSRASSRRSAPSSRNEYVVTYRSVLPPNVKAIVTATAPEYRPARATYTTPPLALSTDRGTFEQSWLDEVIVSPYLAVFIVVSVIALLALALLTLVDARNRSLRRRMADYVTVPTEEEGKIRRAEVTAMLAAGAQRRVEGHRWWQAFERDVELGGFKYTPVGIAGWTIIGAIVDLDRGRDRIPVPLGIAGRPLRPVRDALHRQEPRQQEAKGVPRAAAGQPRRSRRRAPGRAQPGRRDERHARGRCGAVQVGVPPCPPGRAARRSPRRRTDGHVPAGWTTWTWSRSRS